MTIMQICSNTPPFTKSVKVSDGCEQEIIEKEISKRLVNLFGTKDLKVEAEVNLERDMYTLYAVYIKNPGGNIITTMWVRWYEGVDGATI